MQGSNKKNILQPVRTRQRPQNDFMTNLARIGVPIVNKSLHNDSFAGSTIEAAGPRDVNRSFAIPASTKNHLSNTELPTPRLGSVFKNPRSTRMSFSKQPSLQQINERVRGGSIGAPPKIPKPKALLNGKATDRLVNNLMDLQRSSLAA
jgi:hypothetical protein